MKAIILAAGEGLRCRPLTFTRSKVMLPVANKPILEHVIHSLATNGIQDIILIVGYEKERIMNHFKDGVGFGVNIQYIEQTAQLGTAHAIEMAHKLIESDDEQFLVLNGDNIIEPCTISDLVSQCQGDATILTTRREHTTGYGVVNADGKTVREIIEKSTTPISHLVNTGIYVFNSRIFQEIERTAISQRGEYEITDTLQQMIDEGMDVTMVSTGSLWLDAVYAWDLLEANSTILNISELGSVKGSVKDGAVIIGDVQIGNNTTIHPGCYIVGPVAIGDNCDIGPHAVILPSTTIGDNTSIGSFTHIQNTIIMNDVRIGTHGYISSSVIGSNNSIGPYFITEEKDNVSMEVEEVLTNAGKLGTITGDDTVIGHRVLVKAGALIAANCSIESGNVITKHLPVNSIVI
ncbi:MAG: bifunctional sugar-1-phosphate nucleotidylyltransferase/acetyltransferase [Euryarchaeota archaeon]|nr:bifunctional sugar-1-phosphate nucleotidylyltransferase/acetyltransferase [Euryarchaeota archaeon]